MSEKNKYEDMTRDELYEIARELDISGKSKMKKDELRQAVMEHQGKGKEAPKGRKKEGGKKLDDKQKRKRLIDFIDEKVFDPILNADPDKYSGKEKEKVQELIDKTVDEKKHFHKDYKSPEDIRGGYLQNTTSSTGKRVNKELQNLGLPSLTGYKEEFRKLCDELGVK